jgi:hypothetical protein
MTLLRLPLLLITLLGTGCLIHNDLWEDLSKQVEDGTDRDGDGVVAAEDCDDNNPRVHPGAPEYCDKLDNDCDGEVDDHAGPIWFADSDEDGFGDPASTTQACEQPEGHVADGSDCDDDEPKAWPGNPEICDGIDNDCSDTPDDGPAVPWYRDTDLDRFGDPDASSEASCPPIGFVADDQDCDDTLPLINPLADELCNQVDDDCDDKIDDEDDDVGGPDILDYWSDGDGDSYGDPATVAQACEPPPGVVYNGLDCDDGDPSIGASTEWVLDGDGDGFGAGPVSASDCLPPSVDHVPVRPQEDCHDGNPAIHPDAVEVCEDMTDQNCDLVDAVCHIDPEGNLLASSAEATLLGNSERDWVGYAVTGGDLDGDGFGDVVTGASSLDGPAGIDVGKVYVHYGAPYGDIVLEFGAHGSVIGEAPGDKFGGAVALLPPQALDATTLLAMGARLHDGGDIDAGAVYLMAPPVGAAFAADAITLIGEERGDQAGEHLASAGDTNADGYADLLVGAEGYDNGMAEDAGAAYLLRGPFTADLDLGDATAQLIGVSAGDSAGDQVIGPGDIDGDGLDDVAVGAFGVDAKSGAMYLLYSPISGTLSLTEADLTVRSADDGERLSFGTGGGGDVDGDGRPDMLVGARYANRGGNNSGAAYLFTALDLATAPAEIDTQAATAMLAGESDADQAGRSVDIVPDMNNDGYDEMLVGAEQAGEFVTSGSAYLVLGPVEGGFSLESAAVVIRGESSGDHLGYACSSAGDLDHDGYGDVLIGAYLADRFGLASSGAVYVLYGGPFLE